jgi:hypothetical protein
MHAFHYFPSHFRISVDASPYKQTSPKRFVFSGPLLDDEEMLSIFSQVFLLKLFITVLQNTKTGRK